MLSFEPNTSKPLRPKAQTTYKLAIRPILAIKVSIRALKKKKRRFSVVIAMEYTHYYVPPLRTEICEDAGFGFMVGMAWGCGFNFIKGACNKSNRGNRLMGGLQSVHINHYGASCGGRFAAYTVLAECFLRGMNSLRQGRWNGEISGAVAGGIVQMGRGVTGISKGVILGSSFAAFVNQLWVIEKNFPENVGLIDRNTLNKKNYTVWSKPDAY